MASKRRTSSCDVDPFCEALAPPRIVFRYGMKLGKIKSDYPYHLHPLTSALLIVSGSSIRALVPFCETGCRQSGSTSCSCTSNFVGTMTSSTSRNWMNWPEPEVSHASGRRHPKAWSGVRPSLAASAWPTCPYCSSNIVNGHALLVVMPHARTLSMIDQLLDEAYEKFVAICLCLGFLARS